MVLELSRLEAALKDGVAFSASLGLQTKQKNMRKTTPPPPTNRTAVNGPSSHRHTRTTSLKRLPDTNGTPPPSSATPPLFHLPVSRKEIYM